MQSSIVKVALVATLLGAGVLSSAAQQVCTGPFASCAQAVRATCSLDPDGVQRITYTDYGRGNTAIFQQCVGRIYVSQGYPNPYDSGAPAGNAALPFPRTTLNYSDDP